MLLFELRVIIFKLGRKHHKLTAEVCYILNGSNRCLYWGNHVLFDGVNRIGDYLFRWFWKMKDFNSLICIRSSKFDGRVEYASSSSYLFQSIGLDVIYPFVICIVGFGKVRILYLTTINVIGLYLWCSYSIFRKLYRQVRILGSDVIDA